MNMSGIVAEFSFLCSDEAVKQNMIIKIQDVGCHCTISSTVNCLDCQSV